MSRVPAWAGAMILLGILAPLAWPQAETWVEPEVVVTGGVVRLVLEVESLQRKRVPDLVLPDGLTRVGVGESNLVPIIEGDQIGLRRRFVYRVRAGRAGLFQIGPVEISRGRETVSADPWQLRVVDSMLLEDKIYLRQSIEPSVAYEGQIVRLRAECWLWRDLQLHSIDARPPAAPGLATAQNLPLDPKRHRIEVRDGLTYDVFSIERRVVARDEGRVAIEPARLRVEVEDTWSPRSGKDVPRVDRTLRSAGGVLEVQALPDRGRPGTFGGWVGPLEVRGRLHQARTRVGEGHLFDLRVRGECDSFEIDPPALERWGDFEIRGPIRLEENEREGVTFRYTLVPRHAGTLLTPRFLCCWFDPQEGRYVERAVGPFPVRVREAEEQGRVPAPASTAENSPGNRSLGDPRRRRVRGAIVAGFAGCLALLLVLRRRWRGALLCGLLAASLLVFWSVDHFRVVAVVRTGGARLYAGPDRWGSAPIADLPEGARLRVLERGTDWITVENSAGFRGRVESERLEGP